MVDLGHPRLRHSQLGFLRGSIGFQEKFVGEQMQGGVVQVVICLFGELCELAKRFARRRIFTKKFNRLCSDVFLWVIKFF